MSNQPVVVQSGGPMGPSNEHVRSIALDLILTILLCGLFNLYVQYRQMVAVNAMLRQEKYSFLIWFFLTLITCGLYHIYHEYRKSSDIAGVMGDMNSNEPIISIILTCFGLHIIADAIQQSKINQYYGNTEL